MPARTEVLVNPKPPRTMRPRERWALANVKALVKEAMGEAHIIGYGEQDDGEWVYLVQKGKRRAIIHSPGCPRSWVQDPLAPGVVLPARFYVDGSSWTWNLAVEVLRETLGPRARED